MSAFRSLAVHRQLRQLNKIASVQLLSFTCGTSPQGPSPSQSRGVCKVKKVLEISHVHQCSFYLNTQVRSYCDEAEFKHKTEVSYEELLALLESDDIQLFDVREPKELEDTGTIPNATNIPLTQIKEALSMDEAKFAEHYCVSHPDKLDRNIVFYGLGPIKSTAALELAFKLGYKKARHFPGGWEEWSNKQESH